MPEPVGFTEVPTTRTFGAGLKRKRIEFVPPETPSLINRPEKAPNRSLGDLYLAITLKDGGVPCSSPAKATDSPVSTKNHNVEPANGLEECDICKICKLPIQKTASPSHELSLAHQVCAEHSYPPSHLDRGRQGLKYLSSYGWDPDSRLGLGASGSGITVPIKAKVKHDTIGLGVTLPDGKQNMEKKAEQLGAKEIRKLEAKNKKHREKLHQRFYGNEDIEKYLGAGW